MNHIRFQAKRFLDPSSIFHTDIDEAMQRLTLCIQTLRHFRSLFDEYKESLETFFDAAKRPPIYWTFHPNAVFERFNAFLDRLNTIQWYPLSICEYTWRIQGLPQILLFRFFCTVIEFLKLEKVEIGGLKGRQLSSKITSIYVEFNHYFTAFASKTYDVLDPDDPTFNKDFEIFQERILELDMKLAAILCQAFDDCHNLESVFKLISIVGSVLDRPKIKQEFTNKYSEILMMLDEEITTCENIYTFQMQYHLVNGYLFVDRSFPATTSALRWVRQLSARISAPIKNFQSLRHPISKSDTAKMLYERYDTLMKNLGMFEEEVMNDWTQKVPAQIESNLKKSLIARAKDGLLALNFSPELFAILREVHYLTLMDREGIPAEGIKFAESNDLYRNFTLNLEKTIDWYNRVGKGDGESRTSSNECKSIFADCSEKHQSRTGID